jgi:hypothetical protein
MYIHFMKVRAWNPAIVRKGDREYPIVEEWAISSGIATTCATSTVW